MTLSERLKDHDILRQLLYNILIIEGYFDKLFEDNVEAVSEAEVIGYKWDRNTGVVIVYVIYPDEVVETGIGFEEMNIPENLLEQYYESSEKEAKVIRDYR